MGAPLAGIRVVDFTRVLAGPYCTMLLADLGADVIKIEAPDGGDETRGWGPPFAGTEAAYYLAVNRGKRSCALDIRTPEGLGLAHELVRHADVVVENFRAGTAERLGIGYGELSARNPRLVYCSISGFGSTRAPADRPGYDFVVQAESGLMSVTGERDERPTKVGVAMVDVLAGVNAAVGILAALVRRTESGSGGRVETSLLDSALSGLVNIAQSALVTGAAPERFGNAHPSIVPYETFATRDGEIAIAAANDRLFERLCTVLDCPQLAADSDYASNPARVNNRDALIPLLGERIARWESDPLLEQLGRAGVPSGNVNDVIEAFAAAARSGDSALVPVDHTTIGPLKLVRTAARVDQASPSTLPPPLLGEHTREILMQLGYEGDVDALAERGIVRLTPRP